jgi:hypothetical protein
VSSTWADLGAAKESRRRRNGRRVGFAILLLVVLLGLLGLLGPRERTTHTTVGDYRLTVTHGSLVRSGQPVPLEITVESSQPFDGPIELQLAAGVFDDFDFQNWYPNPDKESRDGDVLDYEFEPPDGARFDLHLDARVAPNLGFGPNRYWVAIVEAGQQVARVDYTVWVMP